MSRPDLAPMLEEALAALGPASPGVGWTVLHVGAGVGAEAAWLAARGCDVVAVEPSVTRRKLAGRLHPAPSVRWMDDRLPSLHGVQRAGLSYDLILLGGAWRYVLPDDRAGAFRKTATLLKPGGLLLMTIRHDADSDAVREIVSLARAHGLHVQRCAPDPVADGRPAGVTVWLSLPDDGTGILPMLRGIILGDDKASTYKLALLRAVARIADTAPNAAVPHDSADSISLPLGLVALHWVRQYLPLVAARLPQLPGNVGPDRLSFAKSGFCALLDLAVSAQDVRVGATINGPRAHALARALAEARRTITDMPARFMRYPGSTSPLFDAVPATPPRLRDALTLDLPTLGAFGTLAVPGPVWRTLQRFAHWIEPVLVAEWARKMRGYAAPLQRVMALGEAEAALVWLDPARDTAVARQAVRRLAQAGVPPSCVWSGARLGAGADGADIDHCLPWSAAACGDLWNLLPAAARVNRVAKADRLPSAAALQAARPRILAWWEAAWRADPALARRFDIEASAALPVACGATLDDVFDGLAWRRLRLRQDQQIAEWAGIETRLDAKARRRQPLI